MITIGADVEGFVKGPNGDIISVTGMIKGTKQKPLLIQHGNLQEDNVCAEFAIDTTETEDQFVQYINFSKESMREHVGTVQYTSAHMFNLDYLNEVGPDVQEFGCQAEMNAYTSAPFPAPDADACGGLRTAGGHVHFGYDTPNPGTTFSTIQALDLILGLPSVIMDMDTCRRKLYGKAGACRVKRYGGEYRALSSFWVNSEDTMRWVYRGIHKAIHMVKMNELQLYHSVISPVEVQDIINSYSTAAAIDACSQLSIEVINAT